MRNILIASDLSARSDRALRRAARLAEERNAALTVLHVIDDDLPIGISEHHETEAKKVLAARLAELGASGEVRLAFGPASVEILRAAERLSADLIVLGAHRAAFFADLVLGATITRIARHATQPLLLVAGEAEAAYASVVAGVDFSAHAKRALQLAAEAAPKAEICALHTYHIAFKGFQTGGPDSEVARKLAQPIEESAAKEMDAFLAASGVDRARIVTRIVEEGPDAGLRDTVAERKADLLAIGAHGRSGLARAFLGSLAEEMLMDPPCDVLVARGLVRE